MTTPRSMFAGGDSAGVTLVEVMIALVVLAIGILGFSKMFPNAIRAQVKSKMVTNGGQFANEKIESLRSLPKTSSLLSVGRHPATGVETVGTPGSWQRYYVVTQLAAPLDSLLRVDVTVKWQSSRPESIRLADYLMP